MTSAGRTRILVPDPLDFGHERGGLMRTVHVTATWRSYHDIEVPDDFQDTGSLSDFPPEALEEIESHTAELVDWKVR